MKTRKNSVYVILLSLLISPVVNAQIIKAGFNAANISINNSGEIDKAKVLGTFHVGIGGDIQLASMLYFQPAVLFTGKGSKTESGVPADANYYRATTNPYYIEIPANLVFKTPGKSCRFFAGAGPYIAIGVAGKNKVEGKFLGAAFKSEEKIKWSNDDPSTLDYEEGSGYGILKRFDYGLNAVAGIEGSKVLLSAGYGYGLAKLQSGSNSSSNDKNKHRVFSLSIGIKL